jgi:hypothetical protein
MGTPGRDTKTETHARERAAIKRALLAVDEAQLPTREAF